MNAQGFSKPAGQLQARLVTRSLSAVPARELSLRELYAFVLPRLGLPWAMFVWRLRNFPNIWRGLWRITLARLLKIPHFYGRLAVVKIDGKTGALIDYGIASLRVVTTVGVGYIVDAFQNSVEMENQKFHALGTGTNAEASGDTALQTELTTEYTGNVRATGTTTEGASANIYRTVGTNTLDSGTPAVTEHGILSQAATGGGVLLDRSVFSAINLVGANGDGLQTTYDLTFSAGG